MPWPCPPRTCSDSAVVAELSRGAAEGAGSSDAPAGTGSTRPRWSSAYLRCQKSSREWTTGTSSKLYSGGGEEVVHSSVRASHGSAGASLGLRIVMITFTRNSPIDAAIMNAPIVETRFQKLHPWFGPYR